MINPLDQILSRISQIETTANFDTELAAMQAMRDGVISSPQRFANLLLISLRITGTGVSYRSAHEEFVFRDPKFYLNAEFLERCQGLPVILEHPQGNVLDSQEFNDRIVGMIAIPYIKADEIWGIAKIYDAAAAQLLETEKLSTSPAVILKPGEAGGTKIETSDGSVVLLEGKPFLIDSLAICTRGVWDKFGPPSGVDNHNFNGEIKMDSVESLKRQVAELERRLGPPMCQEMRSEFVACQARADSVMRAFGDSAPTFMDGEKLLSYRSRLLKPLQKYSRQFKDANLDRVSDLAAFAGVENEIYADAAAQALHPTGGFGPGELRSIVSPDPSGRPVTRYVGHDGACWDGFNPPIRYVRRFNVSGTGV